MPLSPFIAERHAIIITLTLFSPLLRHLRYYAIISLFHYFRHSPLLLLYYYYAIAIIISPLFSLSQIIIIIIIIADIDMPLAMPLRCHDDFHFATPLFYCHYFLFIIYTLMPLIAIIRHYFMPRHY
jgi:hypothetical protein